jgi:hypothetical protein
VNGTGIITIDVHDIYSEYDDSLIHLTKYNPGITIRLSDFFMMKRSSTNAVIIDSTENDIPSISLFNISCNNVITLIKDLKNGVDIPNRYSLGQAVLYSSKDYIVDSFVNGVSCFSGNTDPTVTSSGGFISQDRHRGFMFFNRTEERPKWVSYVSLGNIRWVDPFGRTAKRHAGGYTYRANLALNNGSDIGYDFFYTPLGKPNYWSGTKWVEADGATADVKRCGTTTNRPNGSDIYEGFIYFDTTLGKPVYAKEIDAEHDTVTWVDATGATV